MSPQTHLNSIELERIERELYALFEAEQAARLRSFALPVGYEKSQAVAEYWNAMAAGSAMRRRRERFLAACECRTGGRSNVSGLCPSPGSVWPCR
jgi:hypothetical protein